MEDGLRADGESSASNWGGHRARPVFSNSGLSLEQPEIDEAKRVDPL
jgi:hypothetical protein